MTATAKLTIIAHTLAFVVGVAPTALAGPQMPKEMRGKWCPADEGSHCSKVMIVTSSKVMWRGGEGEELGCDVKGIRSRAKAWEVDLVCYGEGGRDRTKQAWSISGTRLLVNSGSFVRRAEVGIPDSSDVEGDAGTAHAGRTALSAAKPNIPDYFIARWCGDNNGYISREPSYLNPTGVCLEDEDTLIIDRNGYGTKDGYCEANSIKAWTDWGEARNTKQMGAPAIQISATCRDKDYANSRREFIVMYVTKGSLMIRQRTK